MDASVSEPQRVFAWVGRGRGCHVVKQFEQAIGETRPRGLARVAGSLVPGVNAMAAPIFDSGGNIVLAMTGMGPSATFDASWNGEIARALKDSANKRLAVPGSRRPGGRKRREPELRGSRVLANRSANRRALPNAGRRARAHVGLGMRASMLRPATTRRCRWRSGTQAMGN